MTGEGTPEDIGQKESMERRADQRGILRKWAVYLMTHYLHHPYQPASSKPSKTLQKNSADHIKSL